MNATQMNSPIVIAAMIAAHDTNTSGNKKNDTGRNITPIMRGYAAFWYLIYETRMNKDTITIEKNPPVIHSQPISAKVR